MLGSGKPASLIDCLICASFDVVTFASTAVIGVEYLPPFEPTFVCQGDKGRQKRARRGRPATPSPERAAAPGALRCALAAGFTDLCSKYILYLYLFVFASRTRARMNRTHTRAGPPKRGTRARSPSHCARGLLACLFFFDPCHGIFYVCVFCVCVFPSTRFT